MSQRWIVTALGQDRPGIVAGVAEVLYRLGCNLEDSAMTRLEGEFAIMLIFSSPAGSSAQSLSRAFRPLERRLKLVVHLKPLTGRETRAPRPRGRPHVISVYGADRPGIVYRVSQLLARAGVNITDVHTHRSPSTRSARSGSRAKSRDAGPALYAMLLEVELPGGRSPKAVEQRLRQAAKRLRVRLSLRPAEAAVL
jgi:glycine cleavage system transcriptional repressor